LFGAAPRRHLPATEIQVGMVEFGLRFLKGPWATAALVCLAALVVLFALAGQTANAPFVYTAPK
jgi:hypothetical protein